MIKSDKSFPLGVEIYLIEARLVDQLESHNSPLVSVHLWLLGLAEV